MTAAPYIPAGGFAGKLRRLAARTLAVAPLDIRLERTVITFTFDDFPKSAATTAAAALEDEGWRATYYAAAGFAGGENHHGPLFEADDLERLTRAGHEIACHTFSHLDAGQSALEAFEEDIQHNAAALGALGHDRPLTGFAFPFGEATPAAKRALASRFRALRGVRPGVNRGRADRALLKATPLDGGEAGLGRALEALRDAVADPGWLIFYCHDVQDSPSDWGCTPAFLEAVIDAVRQSGADVLTMQAALDRIEGAAP